MAFKYSQNVYFFKLMQAGFTVSFCRRGNNVQKRIKVGTYEAQTKLPELLRGVQDGYEYEITNRGVVVASLVSAQDERRQGVEAAIAQIKALMKQRLVKGAHIKALIEEGRA